MTGLDFNDSMTLLLSYCHVPFRDRKAWIDEYWNYYREKSAESFQAAVRRFMDLVSDTGFARSIPPPKRLEAMTAPAKAPTPVRLLQPEKPVSADDPQVIKGYFWLKANSPGLLAKMPAHIRKKIEAHIPDAF